jgi:hypothetical protein
MQVRVPGVLEFQHGDILEVGRIPPPRGEILVPQFPEIGHGGAYLVRIEWCAVGVVYTRYLRGVQGKCPEPA